MTQSIFIKVNTDLIKLGIASSLSSNAFKTLITLSCYMNSEGVCFPSQRELAEKLNISTPTLKKAIDELLGFKINDKPILTREFKGGGRGKRSVYTIHPVSQISIFGNNTGEKLKKEVKVSRKDPSVSKFNSHSILRYFMEKYVEVYGDEYSPNFIRDCSLIKEKLIKVYKEEEIKTIIDILFQEYDKRWKKDRYPRPTVIALCSFLINECLSIKSEREKKWMEEQKALEDSEKYKEQMKNMNDSNLPF
jgi:hypothetical protein